MKMHLSIRNKLRVSGLLSIIFLLTVGAASYLAVDRLDQAMDDVVNDGAALRHQMEVDMMHDALRADVLAAVLASQQADATQQKMIRDEVAAHSQSFGTALKELQALQLPPATRGALDAVRPRLEAYVAQAGTLVGLAFSNRDAGSRSHGF